MNSKEINNYLKVENPQVFNDDRIHLDSGTISNKGKSVEGKGKNRVKGKEVHLGSKTKIRAAVLKPIRVGLILMLMWAVRELMMVDFWILWRMSYGVKRCPLKLSKFLLI